MHERMKFCRASFYYFTRAKPDEKSAGVGSIKCWGWPHGRIVLNSDFPLTLALAILYSNGDVCATDVFSFLSIK